MMRTLLLLISIVLHVSYSQAATCSCAGVPLLNSLEATSVEGGKFVAALSHEIHDIDDLYSGSKRVNDETFRDRETRSTLLQLDYGLNRQWSITTMFSHIEHRRQVGLFDGSAERASGVGDTLLLVKWTPQRIDLYSQWEYAVGFGAKIPVGEDNATANGIPLAEDMQPSTGAHAWVGWGYISRAFDVASRWQGFASMNYSDNRQNSRDYAFGDALNISLGSAYYLENGLAISGQIRWRDSQADKRAGVEIPNTGGQWIDFLPTLYYQMSDAFGVRLTATIPVHRDLDGALQFTTSKALAASVTYVF